MCMVSIKNRKEGKKMNVIKRSGKEVNFDISKIYNAIVGANESIDEKSARLTSDQIEKILDDVVLKCKGLGRAVGVEEIQDFVEEEIFEKGAFKVAKSYITYRYRHQLMRQSNTTDDYILSLLDGDNEEVKQENSNKNPSVVSVQRDYMAGEVSKDITNRFLLDEDIKQAHKNGIIHFHDADYFAQHMHNCDLVNLEDMLQNGTVISQTLIEKPHSFSTACNIATQIIAQVASSQYGGQSISLTHLAPFVDISRKKINKEVIEEFSKLNINATQEQINHIVEDRLRKEVERGVQTIQYQVVTLMTTNGQAPFITEFMYLNEAKNEQEKADLALIIEETLKQRIIGTKNEKGIYITPAFPKIIYVLESDNIEEDGPYYYLTELAAKCTAKRMVPDYISEKVMLENKIDKNGTYFKYDEAFFWLDDSMICNLCYKCTDPSIGLSLNKDNSSIKCYMADTGLLVSMVLKNNDNKAMELYKKIMNNKVSFNSGMLYENIIAQTLVSKGFDLYFYSHYNKTNKKNDIKIDFLVIKNGKVVPIEVKSSKNYTTSSYDKFKKIYKKRVGESYIIHPKALNIEGNNYKIPAYMAYCLFD